MTLTFEHVPSLLTFRRDFSSWLFTKLVSEMSATDVCSRSLLLSTDATVVDNEAEVGCVNPHGHDLPAELWTSIYTHLDLNEDRLCKTVACHRLDYADYR